MEQSEVGLEPGALPGLLSVTVQGLLRGGYELIELERQAGALGTRIMLIATYRSGGSSRNDDGPSGLARVIDGLNAGAFERACQASLDHGRAPPDRPLPTPKISERLLAVFNDAQTFPSPDGILAARHLIVALLRQRESGAVELLEAAGIDRTAVLSGFLNSLVAHGPEAEREFWQQLLSSPDHDSAGRVPTEAFSARSLTPGFDADFPSGRAADDCLDLTATISAMANLIASPTLDGNLSLGVFGNWGSGKSFFMRRLRGAIDDLSELAAHDASGGIEELPAHWPNVVQIEFNAWHYSDANLWASLVAHLLEQLRAFRPRIEQASAQKSALDQAFEQLRLAVAARDEAASLEKQAIAARDKAQTALDGAAKQKAQLVSQLSQAVARSIWVDVSEKMKTSGVAKELNEARRQAKLTTAAVDEASSSIQPLYDEIRDLTSTGGRLRALLLNVLREPQGGRVLVEGAALIALPLLALLVLFLWKEQLRSASAALVTSLAGATAAIAKIAVWLRARSKEVLDAIEPLVKTRARIEAALNEAQQARAGEIAELEKRLAIESAALDKAQRDVAAREEQVQVAAASVSAVATGSAIARFVEQRFASSEYQKRLGLIAVIRQDFEQLCQLILGHNAQRRRIARDAQTIREQVQRALPKLEPAKLEAMLQNLGINRIVIYIDDLDRCPPSLVVEVLQAIHLLLAFPVFVVVVGVDARWVTHALAQEFPALTETPGAQATAPAAAAALDRVTPWDYLEKIFQIPFWIPPLDADGTRSLLGKLTRPRLNDATSRAHAVELEPRERRATPGLPSTRTEATTRTERASSAPAQASEPDAKPKRIKPEPLELNGEERAAMGELALLIGRSPRAVTRFANTYRLLRAALSEKERKQLGATADKLGGLAAPMLMLAVVTGAPNLAGRFLGPALRTASSPLEHLKSLSQLPPTDLAGVDTLARVRKFCDAPPPRWQVLRSSDLAFWSTRVAQFAFEDLATAAEA